MVESWISALPWGVLTTSAEGRPPALIGTRDERMAPHGTFPADGDYAWVAVAVADDDEFGRLATAIGRPELAADPRFASLAARQANEDALEELLARWTIDPPARRGRRDARGGGRHGRPRCARWTRSRRRRTCTSAASSSSSTTRRPAPAR